MEMVQSDRRKWLALALLSTVQFMVVLDMAIVNVALPSIRVDLGFSQDDLQWVISAYALVFGGFLLLGGRASDVLGRRKLVAAGILVFTLASLLAGFAWSEASLIGARALQGLGAAVITPAALSILSTTFTEGRERNIALGVWGAVGGFGAVLVMAIVYSSQVTDALHTQPGSGIDDWAALVLEIIGTALFVMVILTVATDERAAWNGVMAPFLIGLFIFTAAVTVGPASGGSFNPARSLDPVLYNQEWGDVWIYIVGPLIGGVLGAAIWAQLLLRRPTPDPEHETSRV